MAKKFIAKALKGSEFQFSTSELIAVPEKSAKRIATLLNAHSYHLKPGQVWFVYDNDYYYDSLITAEIKKCGKRRIIFYNYER